MAEALDLNDAPPSETKSYLYNCSECESNIEIISLNENKIKFICYNKHNIDIKINEYLKKMKQYNNIKLNDDKCGEHKQEYLSYCFDCNIHLCKECLKTRKHSYHYKIYIIEILPQKEALDNIINIISETKIKIENLKDAEKKTENNLKNILKNNIDKIKDTMNNNKDNYNKKEKEELKLNDENYKKKLKKLKEEYENKIKKEKLKYNSNINNIRNKYKIKNNKNENRYNNKIDELNKKIERKIYEYKCIYKEKIERKLNYNKIIEIINNTYDSYNNNYYNSINISNIYKISRNTI